MQRIVGELEHVSWHEQGYETLGRLVSGLHGGQGTLVTVSEAFVTIRAVLDHLPGAWASISVNDGPEDHTAAQCSLCEHDFMDHRLYPFIEERALAGGLTSCPLCDCSGTFAFISSDLPPDGSE